MSQKNHLCFVTVEILPLVYTTSLHVNTELCEGDKSSFYQNVCRHLHSYLEFYT